MNNNILELIIQAKHYRLFTFLLLDTLTIKWPPFTPLSLPPPLRYKGFQQAVNTS